MKLVENIVDIFKKLFSSIWDMIIGPFKELKSFETLIYGKDGDEALAFGIFKENEIEKIFGPGIEVTTILAVFAILLGIVIWGMRIAQSGINPSNRTRAIEMILDIIVVTLLFYHLPQFYELIFAVNYSIVNLFYDAKEGNLIDFTKPIDADDDVLGNLIIQLVLLGLAIWANFYYMMRKLTLLIFMILGPFMVALYMIQYTKSITAAWMKELVGTVFIQSIHAFLFWIVTLISFSTKGIEAIILYVCFIPLTEAMRSLFGLGGQTHGVLSKVGAAFGLSALAGVYGSIKGAKDGKSVMESIKGGYNGLKNKVGNKNQDDGETTKGQAANLGTDTGSTSLAEKMLKSGDLVSKAGKAVFGMAGSIAGSPMGPGGSLTLSTIGSEVGGAVGGMAGRTGFAGAQLLNDSAKKAIKGFKSGASNAWNSEKLAEDQLAENLANDATTKWASENVDSFMKNAKERFPDADETSLNNLWGNELDKKKNEFKKDALSHVKAIKQNDGKMANSKDLINASSSALANKWAADNKEDFLNDYDKNHPLRENATEAEKNTHNVEREQAWNKAFDNKKKSFGNLAKAAAKNQLGDIPNASGYIDKDDFNSDLAQNVINDEKAGFLKTYLKQNPNASNEEAETAYIDSVGGSDRNRFKEVKSAANQATSRIAAQKLFKGNEVNSNYLNSQLAALKTAEDKEAFLTNYNNNSPMASAANLVDTSAEALTSNWANDNKSAFMSSYDKTHPISSSASPIEKKAHGEARQQAWQTTVDSQREHYKGIASESVAAISGGSGEPIGEKTLVNKGAFQDVFSSKAYAADKKMNSSLADLGSDGYSQIVSRSTKDVAPVSDNSSALLAWDKVASKTYHDNLSSLQDGSASYKALDYAVVPKTKALGIGAASMAIGSGLKQGAIDASNYKAISGFVKESKIGAAATAGIISLQDNFSLAKEEHGGILNSFRNSGMSGIHETVVSPALQATNDAVSTFKDHVPADLVQRHVGYKNGIAFAGGLIGGVTGYQKAARAAVSHNPYNKGLNNQIGEISEIKQMAESYTDASGISQVSSGAIRMVTDNNQSYLQVRDKTGHYRSVSRIGSGDSSLSNGQTVYQELSLHNDRLTANTTPFYFDSGGAKVEHGRPVNVNPNRLVANRHSGNMPKEIQSYNQNVDSGQFYVSDLAANFNNVQHVIERNRSYVVATNDNGEQYRVSRYGDGDARLSPDETVYQSCEVNNLKLNPSGAAILQVGDKQSSIGRYTSTLDPSDLITVKPNKRRANRTIIDANRYKGMGGNF